MKAVQRAHLSEIDEVAGGDWPRLRPVRLHFDLDAFGVNVWSAPRAGAHVIQPHHEENPNTLRHQELYLVLDGHATFTVGDEDIDAPQGTFVFVRDPKATRSAVAKVEGTTILAIGGEPGRPYAVGPWEWNYRAILAFERGADEEARAILEEGLRRYPGHSRLLYNMACAAARRGDREAALAGLSQAVEADQILAERARGDPDFAQLLGDPRFPT